MFKLIPYLPAYNTSKIELIGAIHGHHKHLKDVLDMCRSINFVMFTGYLHMRLKATLGSLAPRFPLQSVNLDWLNFGNNVFI